MTDHSEYTVSIHYDRRLYRQDIAGSKAHAAMLAQQGIITRDDADSIIAGLSTVQDEIEHGDFPWDPALEDLHMNIERRLTDLIGPAAGRLHTGRSRNDQIALDMRLYTRQAIADAVSALRNVQRALTQLAEQNAGVVMPGYTHLQRAQPVLFAHHMLAYFEMFWRDWQRLQQAYERTDVSPLGSGALAGSGFPFDRDAMAADLGFASVSRNSLDVVADRDFALDFLYAASVTMLHASRLAEDWILYSSEEFGFLEMGDEVTSGSSLMPQKRNPDALELLRGKTGRACGNLQSLMMTLKGLPLAYNRDLQEDKECVFETADQVSESIGILALCVDTARLRPEAMERAAEDGWVSATALAEILARAGVSFHRAHQIVGGIVLSSVKHGKRPRDWTLDELREFAPELDERAMAALAPRQALGNHAVVGGTAPEAVGAARQAAKERLESLAEVSRSGAD